MRKRRPMGNSKRTHTVELSAGCLVVRIAVRIAGYTADSIGRSSAAVRIVADKGIADLRTADDRHMIVVDQHHVKPAVDDCDATGFAVTFASALKFNNRIMQRRLRPISEN